MLVGGIDDSGRGPMIGPMCLSLVTTNDDDYSLVWPDKVVDSKELGKRALEKVFNQISKLESIVIYREKITAEEISHRMLAGTNMDIIIQEHLITLINKCPGLQFIWMDQFGFEQQIKTGIETATGINIHMEPKADVNYPIVSAASIVAKMHRETEMIKIQKLTPFRIGSGYPADQVTCNWLRRNIHPVTGYPNFVRYSWAPVQKMLHENACKVTWKHEKAVAKILEKRKNGGAQASKKNHNR